VAIVTARGHLPALWRSAMYGWLDADDAGRVNAVAVKQLVAGVAPEQQQVLTGTFWFRTRALYDDLYAALRAADERVRGEFYVDSMARLAVERGLRVRAITVDKFMPWGTPEELMTFDYWNDVFRNGRALCSGDGR
jgi:bifunctional N-acetylglucosamine-1-phosphate-uridyltransferase/glucosamine-1-phosphate-acetyltransferase GlmU-like protein